MSPSGLIFCVWALGGACQRYGLEAAQVIRRALRVARRREDSALSSFRTFSQLAM